MTIDLMALAKKADETYKDVKTTKGVVRVYHVPDAVLLVGSSIFDEPDPPTVLMKTATGTQERPARKGEKVYDEWQKEIAVIRQKQFEIRQARGFVEALQDIDWSNVDLSKPPPNKVAQSFSSYRGHWPDEEVLRKMAWLDLTFLNVREDKQKILAAMNEMNQAYEPTEEMVEEVKKNSA